ncbi:MAG: nickel pincer cofactor biosynthesis protein LarB [Bacillota bacterium]
MNPERLRELLLQVKEGHVDIDAALEELKILPYEDLGFAKLDHHRTLRNGFPEVVFCQGKTPQQILQILSRLADRGNTVLATRVGEEVFNAIAGELPAAQYHNLARCITVEGERKPTPGGKILIISAGTADLPVAEEAAITAEVMGNEVERLYDVGVAGIHRLLDHQKRLHMTQVLIVVAGMEGALASVVGGLVGKPVIAVPTSVGYGASFGGIAALLGMLNTCASGVGVVNIDNGFGAAALANAIVRCNEVI